MCMMALGIIAGIGQAVAGFAAANQQANEQNAYYEQNRVAAVAAANDRYAALANNTLQHRESASADLMQKRIDALKAKATARTAAGEGGVTGLSVDALLGDLQAQHDRQAESIRINYDIKKGQNQDEAISTYHNTISRINSVRRASKPSPLPFIFQGLSAVAGGMG